MTHLIDILDGITATPEGGFRLTAAAEAFIRPYLAKHGFTLDRLRTHDELVDALRECNATDFEVLASRPGPDPKRVGLLWRAIQGVLRR